MPRVTCVTCGAAHPDARPVARGGPEQVRLPRCKARIQQRVVCLRPGARGRAVTDVTSWERTTNPFTCHVWHGRGATCRTHVGRATYHESRATYYMRYTRRYMRYTRYTRRAWKRWRISSSCRYMRYMRYTRRAWKRWRISSSCRYMRYMRYTRRAWKRWRISSSSSSRSDPTVSGSSGSAGVSADLGRTWERGNHPNQR